MKPLGHKDLSLCDAFSQTAQRLYVVGYARSGTTILMDILNSSPDVFLFSELNLHVLRRFPDCFSSYGGDTFIEQFAVRKKSELPLLYKGAAPPLAGPATGTPDEYLDSLGSRYRYVGDKIATAHRNMGGAWDIELLREFLDKEIQADAELVFTLRRPSTNLASIARMFPHVELPVWGKSLADAMVIILEAHARANRSRIVFHEDIGPTMITDLAYLLRVDCLISPDLVGGKHQTSHGVCPVSSTSWARALDELYQSLYELYRCDKGSIKFSKTDGLIKTLSSYVACLRAVSAGLDAICNTSTTDLPP